MLLTLSGIEIDVRLLHAKNASLPIYFIVEGNVILFRLEQLKNAHLLTPITLYTVFLCFTTSGTFTFPRYSFERLIETSTSYPDGNTLYHTPSVSKYVFDEFL